MWRWLLLIQAGDSEFSSTYQPHTGTRGPVLSQFAMKSDTGVKRAQDRVQNLMACLDVALGGLVNKTKALVLAPAFES